MGANTKYQAGYVLDVEGPIETNSGGYVYKDKATGEIRTGWYHCGCCGRDGFMSTSTPTCTGCANKLQHGLNDSPKTINEIRKYCESFRGV